MIHKIKFNFSYCLLILIFAINACSSTPGKQAYYPPLADVHVHFNWDQHELIEPKEIIQILKEHNISFVVGFSTPSEYILKLKEVGGSMVIPFFSPYLTAQGRSSWYFNEQVLVEARHGLENNIYHGIGEVHVISGIGPRRDNKILNGLLQLAVDYNVPFTIHTEASSYKFLEPLCQQYSTLRFLWAHSGGILGPEHAEGIILSCPNVWIELSARDPHHYGGLLNENGSLREDWRNLFIKYPDRFMVGSDPVWNAHQINRWYEADEGWLHYDKFIQFHHNWLVELPADVAEKIRLNNAKKFFNLL